MTVTEENKPNKWAILIGINCYIAASAKPGPGDGPARDTTFDDLYGCVNDITKMNTYLQEVQGIDKGRIRKYTAMRDPKVDVNQPREPKEKWPTYENITAAIEDITEKAKAGDYVYFQYSGHGARMATIFPDLKKDVGDIDEGLAPTDINNGGRYVRDVELSYLFNKMVEKGILLTVVLDSCHSGGAVRGDEEDYLERSPGKFDGSRHPGDTTKYDMEALTRNWLNQKQRISRAQPSAFLEPFGYQFFAAARANEAAKERPPGSSECSGVFTHTFLGALNSLRTEQETQPVSYQMLHRKVVANIYDGQMAQTPVFVGERDRVFLGAGTIKTTSTIPTTLFWVAGRTEPEPHKSVVKLMAGKAHGVTLGSEYAVYLWNEPETTDPEKAYRRIIVQHVGELISAASIVGGDVDVWPLGAQAVLLRQEKTKTAKRVKILDKIAGVDWEKYGNGIVSLVDSNRIGLSPDYQVAAVDGSGYELLDKKGSKLPNVPASATLDLAMQRLAQVSRYTTLKALRRPSKGSDLTAAFDFVQVSKTALNDTEEEVCFKVQNSSAEALNMVVLHFSPRYGVRQIFPLNTDLDTLNGVMLMNADSDNPTKVKDSRDFSFTRTKPASDAEHDQDVVKLFLSIVSASYRSLEMPDIGTVESDNTVGIWAETPTKDHVIPAKARDLAVKEPEPYNMWDTIDIIVI